MSTALDPKKIAKQYQALIAAPSPARYWTIDWLVDRIGAVRNFEGLDAAWMGNSQAAASNLSPRPTSDRSQAPRSKLSAKPAPEAYRATFVARTSIEGFKKGSQVYLLDDPKGRTWVMVSYTDKDDAGLTIDTLELARRRPQTAAGLEVSHGGAQQGADPGAEGGFAGLTEDDKQNLYDLTGPGQSNFVP